MSLSDYIDVYISGGDADGSGGKEQTSPAGGEAGGSGERGYLAQHQLFDQERRLGAPTGLRGG